MVGIDGGAHGENYDMYDNRINTSIEPGYGYNNYYDGNDGGFYGMSNKYDDPDAYAINYGDHGTGLRKRNLQGGGSGGMQEIQEEPAKGLAEAGHNSSGDEN